ncbi:MAG: hypothetical protein ACK5NK_13055 [Niabella sp.]
MQTTKNKGWQNPVTMIILTFVLLNAVVFLSKTLLESKGMDVKVVLTGNLILFLLCIFTLKRSMKAIDNPNPHVFVRHYYGGFLIRLLAIAVAAFIYIYSSNGNISRITLFSFMGIYAIYSAIEVSSLRKILKEKKNV